MRGQFGDSVAISAFGIKKGTGDFRWRAPDNLACHLGLGKLHRRRGDREQALEHLTTAMAMYREMGMTYWLEQAEAELRQLD